MSKTNKIFEFVITTFNFEYFFNKPIKSKGLHKPTPTRPVPSRRLPTRPDLTRRCIHTEADYDRYVSGRS